MIQNKKKMLIESVICCILSIIIAANRIQATSVTYQPFEENFETGVTAYWNNDWENAIVEIEKSLVMHRLFESGIYDCYMKCKDTRNIENTDRHSQFADIKFIISKASCSRSCLDEIFGDARLITQVSEHIKHLFHIKRPYVYLQFAYFQVGNIEQAVKTAHTYWLRHVGDDVIEDSIEYYRNLTEVKPEFFIDLEASEHIYVYDTAVEIYLDEDYEAAIPLFMRALEAYYTASDKCNALCEGEHVFDYDYPDVPEFHMQTADHYIQVTECSLECVKKIATDSSGVHISDFLPLHYHYLQFAIYKEGNISAALSNAKTYLLFHPEDEVMVNNVNLLSKKVDSKTEAIPEAVLYKKRIDGQIALLRYSYQAFGYEYRTNLLTPFADLTENEDGIDEFFSGHTLQKPNILPSNPEEQFYQSPDEKQKDIIEKKSMEEHILNELEEQRSQQKVAKPDNDVDVSNVSLGEALVDSKDMVTIRDAANETPTAEGNLLFEDYVLVANSTQLNGQERFLVDNLITQNDCDDLINLELSRGLFGDGYQDKKYPHTEYESFQGISIYTAVELAKKSEIPLRIARLYFDTSEKVRAQVQEYFHLPNLYFDYTHLVCRTALPKSSSEREDLSHPVHADNCLLQDNGECLKKPPAYVWRDYSAILYLNNKFEGGNLIFVDSTAKRISAQVEPKCGRMAAFCAGKECFHGVKPVSKGQRCAMALWFTTKKEKQEVQRQIAEETLASLENSKDEL
uniref:procollagen-proline 3-dioxygenase n=1 Tax=Molgula tectiformis TaxID=30286 RepID=A0A9R2_MOLTE|nr:leprecan [Molgula tectiformis]